MSLDVAIKVIDKKKIGNRVKEIKDEIKILSAINHPNIVNLFEEYEDDDSIYIITEFIEGQDFLETVKQNPLEEEDVKEYTRQLLLAVCHIHKLGITHRDLKLDNLLLTTDKRIKLVDFGISKKLGSN